MFFQDEVGCPGLVIAVSVDGQLVWTEGEHVVQKALTSLKMFIYQGWYTLLLSHAKFVTFRLLVAEQMHKQALVAVCSNHTSSVPVTCC